MKSQVVHFNAENGDILGISLGDKKGVFVFEDDFDETTDSKISFLYSIKNHFFGYDNKYSEDLDCINIYAAPGNKASTLSHVKAFLNNLLYDHDEEMAKKIEIIIQCPEDES